VDDGAGPFLVPNTPLHSLDAEARVRAFVPKLGQHCREIFADWLHLSDEQIDALIEQGVIGAQDRGPL